MQNDNIIYLDIPIEALTLLYHTFTHHKSKISAFTNSMNKEIDSFSLSLMCELETKPIVKVSKKSAFTKFRRVISVQVISVSISEIDGDIS